MRFLITFIISGLIYYGLYHYTPEVFTQLVNVADAFFKYGEAFISEVVARIRGASAGTEAAPVEQMLPFLAFLRRR